MITTGQPLADRIRPKTLDEYVGQEHLLGKNAPIRKMLENQHIVSMILWGPPGVGKTTLAFLIAEQLNCAFYTLSAVHSGVKDIRETIEKSKKLNMVSRHTPIVFIDEIHRFSKSQQDSLLQAVESGIIVLIGATTENPSFEVISPLLSRCQVFVLYPLEEKHLDQIVERALTRDYYFKKLIIKLLEKEALYRVSMGDARKLLNALELIVQVHIDEIPEKEIIITNKIVTDILQKNICIYDKKGEQHYNIISAFIKSVRGSDPNAAVYYLARMLEAGEDIEFIARRLIILAAEDIGLANPNALLLANTCFQAIHTIGMPEARIVLSETTIYLACSPKSNSAYKAIDNAIDIVEKTGHLSVPLHLRNAPTILMNKIGYGKEYRYPHDYENNFTIQQYLPEEIKGTKFYFPADNIKENEYKNFLKKKWNDNYKY